MPSLPPSPKAHLTPITALPFYRGYAFPQSWLESEKGSPPIKSLKAASMYMMTVIFAKRRRRLKDRLPDGSSPIQLSRDGSLKGKIWPLFVWDITHFVLRVWARRVVSDDRDEVAAGTYIVSNVPFAFVSIVARYPNNNVMDIRSFTSPTLTKDWEISIMVMAFLCTRRILHRIL